MFATIAVPVEPKAWTAVEFLRLVGVPLLVMWLCMQLGKWASSYGTAHGLRRRPAVQARLAEERRKKAEALGNSSGGVGDASKAGRVFFGSQKGTSR